MEKETETVLDYFFFNGNIFFINQDTRGGIKPEFYVYKNLKEALDRFLNPNSVVVRGEWRDETLYAITFRSPYDFCESPIYLPLKTRREAYNGVDLMHRWVVKLKEKDPEAQQLLRTLITDGISCYINWIVECLSTTSYSYLKTKLLYQHLVRFSVSRKLIGAEEALTSKEETVRKFALKEIRSREKRALFLKKKKEDKLKASTK